MILEKLEGITVTSSMPHNIEIGGETTSKATAIFDLCQRLNIKESANVRYVEENAELEKTRAKIELEELRTKLKKEADKLQKGLDDINANRVYSLDEVFEKII